MKIKIVIFFTLISISCIGQNNDKLNELKNQVVDVLLEKKLISDTKYNFLKKRNNKISVFGLFNKIKKPLIEGIYVVSTGNHSMNNFIIYENNKIIFLDISDEFNLINSINQILDYSNSKKFCRELIFEYLSRVINTFYLKNKLPFKNKNRDCKFEPITKKSIFTRKEVELILKRNHIKLESILDINSIENSDFFYLSKIDSIYHEVKKGILNVGVYEFSMLEKPKKYFLFLDEHRYDIYFLNNYSSLKNIIKEVILFSVERNYCYLKTKQIIKYFVEEFYKKDCFSNLKFELP